MNVEAYDQSDPHYGNGADIYVNDSSTLSGLHETVVRGLFDASETTNDDVEVGWAADASQGPISYAEWVNHGVDSGEQTYKSLSYNSTYNFKVQNDSHDGIFRFYFDSEGTPFNYSPTMTFNQGLVLTNSEHYNSCDSLWTHMTNLSYFRSNGDWQAGYGDLKYYYCNSVNDWLLNNVSNSENYVDQNNGVCYGG